MSTRREWKFRQDDLIGIEITRLGHDLIKFEEIIVREVFPGDDAQVKRIRNEAEHMVQQLRMFAKTENGLGQLAAWQHILSVITGDWSRPTGDT